MVFGIDDVIVGGIIAGGLSAGGQLLANSDNKDENEKNRKFNFEQAQLNRQFQADMSNSAYQRVTQDMTKAGLNPMLAIQNGGASTPSGSAASAGSPIRMESSLAAGASSAMNAMATLGAVRKATADATASESQAAVNAAVLPKIAQEVKTSSATAQEAGARTALLKTQMQAAKNSAERADSVGKVQQS